MDTSETYIKMCEKAKKIQKLRKHIYEEGDYCHCKECGTWLHCEGKLYDFDGIVWLPRQDQLQEMVDITSDIHPATSMDVIIRFHSALVYNLQQDYYKQFTSMEQLWLAFVMKEKYNKVWSGEDWN